MNITLKQKNLADGRISLFIEYYKGSSTNAQGRRVHLRNFEYLKLYLHPDPKSTKEKKDNKETMALAESILAIKKAEYFQGRYDLKDTVKSKRTFLTYFEELTEEKQKQDTSNNYGNWFSTLQHLNKIVPKNMTFDEIDEKFVKKVHRYFESDARTKSELPLSQNSKYSYFNKFKAALRSAFDNGYLTINYAAKVKSFEQAESQREYLIFDELQRLAKTECKYPVLKKAFLFSCLSGLRWSDINTLTYSYRVLLHRTIYIYCCLLPFGLVDSLRWFMPFVVVFTAYTFVAFEAIADEIEEPFGTDANDLALNSMCIMIDETIHEMVGEHIAVSQKITQNIID